MSKFIAICSIGRAGSSVLARSIQGQRTSKNHAFVEDLNRHGFTHSVFTFTDPYNVISSLYNIYKYNIFIPDSGLYGPRFLKNHAHNFKVRSLTAEQIFKRLPTEDVLGLEKMFDGFMNPPEELKARVCTVKYKKMWQVESQIAECLECTIKLPEYKERKNATIPLPSDIEEQIRTTYKSLYEKVKHAPDFMISKS